MIEKKLEALRAGRELDALISQRIFGNCAHLETLLETLSDGTSRKFCKECNEDIVDYVGDFDDGTFKYADSKGWHCPDYSTELNVAFVLVDKLIQDNPSLQIIFTLMTNGKSFLATFNSVAGATNYKAHSSAALAICKSAMMFYRQFFEGDKNY